MTFEKWKLKVGIKQQIGRRSPKWVVRGYRRFATAVEFIRDYRDYSTSTAWEGGSFGSNSRRDEAACLDSRIVINYHGLEKGTSFAEPRRPFGIARKEALISLLAQSAASGHQSPSIGHAESALKALDSFNSSGTISDTTSPKSTWSERIYSDSDIEQFILSRHSVRDFDPLRTLDLDVVKRVVELAGSTPSVCNRRSYRAHYFDERTQMDRLLRLQNGNAGFRSSIPGLIIVTERRSSFVGAGERNQRWIDGGLFAMSLMWLFHAFGLGTCFLNWSESNAQTDRLRKAAGISRTEDVIVMMAVGYPRRGHRVARSPRRPLGDIFVQHVPSF